MVPIGFHTLPRRLPGAPFWCPEEQRESTFERVQRRYWFTFLFIPLVPMRVVEEVLRCTTCGQEVTPEVLSRPHPMFVHLRTVRLARSVASALVGVQPDPRVVAAASEFVRDLDAGRHAVLDGTRVSTSVEVAEHATALAPATPPDRVEDLVGRAFAVAAADYRIGPRDLEVLTALADGLGMPREQFDDLVAAHVGQGGAAPTA